MADYDLAIIGGGLNGVSIARDAVGRGLRVILLEQGDLGAGASLASPRLIHGDLADLERRHFLRVRRALAERDIWLRIAPHLVRPMRFAIPAHSDERTALHLRSWLLVYDRLAARNRLPASATVDVTHHPVGNALKRPFGTAFEYSDCVVDDSRLVVLTAVDAAARGADIRTGARCTRAERDREWRLVTKDRGFRRIVTARAVANATGAWTPSVAETVLRVPPPKVAAVQMDQIVVRRLFDSDNVYVFQNSDGRLIFASPYRGRFHPDRHGQPRLQGRSCHRHDGGRRRRLSLRRRESLFPPADRAGGRGAHAVRRQHGDEARESDFAARWRLDARPRTGQGAADHGVRRRRHHLAAARGTGGLQPDAVLPDVATLDREGAAARRRFRWDRFDNEVDEARERWRFLGEEQARRLVAAYGSNVKEVLGNAREPRRPRPGLRAGIDRRRSALPHGKGMGALSG